MNIYRAPVSRLLWLTLVALISGFAMAQAPASPYQTLVPVTEQSPAELKRGATAGLAEVLARIAGNADVTAQPSLRDALANADRYVDQYRYQRNDDGALMLNLQFAPATIASLLRSTGVQGASANTVVLRVEGVESFEDYAQLLVYLNRLGGGQSAPRAIDAGVVTFDLRAAGGAEQIARQFALEPRLQALPVAIDAGAGNAGASVLSYRWQRVGG